MLKKNTKKYYILIIVMIMFIFFYYLKLLTPVEKILINSINSIAKKSYSISNKNKNNNYTDETQSEVNKLKTENKKLIIDNTKLKIIEQENNELRKYLNFLKIEKNNYLLANVISRGTFFELGDNHQMLVIDRGADDKIIPGLIAVNSKGIVIGKVFEVKKNIAQINLITNTKCKLAVTVQNEDKTMGITEGEMGLTIKMNFIPQTEKIQKGDMIITTGLEKNIPRGLIVGQVNEVEKENNKIWQNAIVEPLVDFDNLTIISILLP